MIGIAINTLLLMKSFQILWPDGTFFLKSTTQSERNDGQSNQQYGQPMKQFPMSQASKAAGSFEQQLEAARRASNVKKILFSEFSILF